MKTLGIDKAKNNKIIYLLALLLIIGTSCLLWFNAKTHSYVPCAMDCGETFVAQKQIQDFKLYGFKYGLLQDHATSDNIEAHPYLYTHNVSIPALLFPLLDYLGVKPFWCKQLISLLVFALGLFYVFKSVLYYTRSNFISIAVLVFFCTDYLHVFSFGMNALRTWHWLVLFGLIFHGSRLFDNFFTKNWIDTIGLFVSAFLAFGIGYDFWVTTIFIGMLLIHASPNRQIMTIVYKLIFLATFFSIPFFLRQIHIITILGYDFWLTDFIYSIAIKVPFLKNIIDLPSLSVVDDYYKAHDILRAPAQQSVSWAQNYRTFLDMLWNILIPHYGSISIFNFALLTIISIFIVLSKNLHILIFRIQEKVVNSIFRMQVKLLNQNTIHKNAIKINYTNIFSMISFLLYSLITLNIIGSFKLGVLFNIFYVVFCFFLIMIFFHKRNSIYLLKFNANKLSLILQLTTFVLIILFCLSLELNKFQTIRPLFRIFGFSFTLLIFGKVIYQLFSNYLISKTNFVWHKKLLNKIKYVFVSAGETTLLIAPTLCKTQPLKMPLMSLKQ